MTLKDKGDLDGAVTAFKEAVRLDPKHARAHTGLGAIHLQRKISPTPSPAPARRSWPTFPNAHALLRFTLQRTGDLPGARLALAEAARLNPKQWGPALAKLLPVVVAPPPREVTRP